MTPRVSIIMGIYNCQNTLSCAIESILGQTYDDWELIMCDDASTDKTFEIADSYRNKFPQKIKLIRNEKNAKLAASLNKCLSMAKGELIARMDADDVSMPDRLLTQISVFDRCPQYDCVGSSIIVFDETGEHGVRECEEFPSKNTLLYGPPFAHPTIMMKKDVYNQLSGYTVSKDTERSEDVDLWFRFYGLGKVGYNIKKPLYKYREGRSDLKKRTIRAAFGTFRVVIRGYKLLGVPKLKYIYAFKTIMVALAPNSLVHLYHRIKDSRG